MQVCDFNGSRPLNPPKDWDQSLDGSCGVLPVIDHIETLSGQNVMFSIYQPTAEDLVALNNGGCLRLGITGRAHPVLQMSVLSPELTKACGVEPKWDMGPVIPLA